MFLRSSHATTPKQLPFGDVNVVVLTDVHSWVAGHAAHEPGLMNANYGDVLSFYERLVQNFPHHQDVFFVMNGDFMDGTGLSSYPPSHLIPILKKMPWDAVNMGNHELYENSTVEYITQEDGFVNHWGGNYLTSNTLLKETMQPIGDRYTYLIGRNTNATILTFGFLYNFEHNCGLTVVERVQDAVQSDWFQEVLQSEEEDSSSSFDAILVLAHMHFEDPLVRVILDAIRDVLPDMPVQFITGHSHIRAYKTLDHAALSFEAGRFLDTIGFASFPIKKKKKKKNDMMSNNKTTTESSSSSFQHVFLDANVHTLKKALGVKTLTTPSGAALTNLIEKTQEELNLLDVLGCASETWDLEQGLDKPNSLWGHYMNDIVPNYFDSDTILVEHAGEFRYSLLEGEIRKDDVVAVTPFNDTYYRVSEHVTGSVLLEVLRDLLVQVREDSLLWPLPEFVVSKEIDPKLTYDLYSVGFNAQMFANRVMNVTGDAVEPTIKYRNGAPLTTGLVWSDYVVNNMHCKSDWHSTAERTTNLFRYLAIALCVVIVLIGWRYQEQRRKKRRGYEASHAEVDLHLEPNYNTIT